MAKTKVEQYIFQPGIPIKDNRYRMAHDLIKNNVEFICDEVTAWIGEQVKLEPTYPDAYAGIVANKEFLKDEVMSWFDIAYPGAHDLKYSVSAATYEPTTGVMELTVGSHGFVVGSTIRINTDSLTFTCAMDSHATNHTYPRATGSNAPGGYDYAYLTPTAITAITSTTITVNVGTSGNQTVHTFISALADCIISNERHEKCERDTGYNIDAITSDLYNGGNSKTIEYAKKYWEGTNSNLANATEQNYAVLVNNKLIEIINDYILTNTAWTTAQVPVVTTQNTSNPLAESNAKNRVTELGTILNDVTVNGLGSMPAVTPSWSNFTYDGVLCERDTRINLQGLDGDGGILYDLRYGGNEQTRYTASKYFIDSTPQIDGDRTPEIFAKNYVRDLINNYILPQPAQAQTYPFALALLDANKEFIADEVMAWFDYNYPTIHNASRHQKCERDTRYNLDAIRSDLYTGGNHQVIKMASKYWQGTTGQLPGGQTLLTTDGAHGRTVGDVVEVRGLILSCEMGTKTYPVADFANIHSSNQTFTVRTQNLTATTFEISLGTSAIAQTYVKGGVAIPQAGVQNNNRLDIRNFDFNISTGIATITTMGGATVTATAHGKDKGDLVAVDGVVLSCAMGSKTYPVNNFSTLHSTNQAFSVSATNLTTDTFEVSFGMSAIAHTYVSGGTIIKDGNVRIAISDFVYVNGTGICTITSADHGLAENDTIQLRGVVMTCVYGTKVYPAIPHAGIYPVTKVTDANTLDFYLPPSEIDHTYVSGGTIKSATLSNVGSSTAISDFVYNNDQALITITSTSHGLGVGDLVKLADVTLSCNTGTKVYPDAKVSSGVFYVYDVPDTNTIIIGMDKSSVAHTYVSGGTCQKVTSATTGSVNVSNFVFDRHAGHGLAGNDNVILRGIVTNCVYGTKVYPALVHAGLYPITKIDTVDSFEFFLPPSEITHTYSSGGAVNDVTISTVGSVAGITGFNYDNILATYTVTSESHALIVGDKIQLAGIGMSCQYGSKTYPENNAGIFVVYDVVDADTFILGGNKSEIIHTYTGGGTWQKITYTTSNTTSATSFSFGTSETSYAIAINNKVKDIVNDYIFPNVAYTTMQSPIVSTQTILANSESGSDTRVTSLVSIINNITQNGLSTAPTPGYASAGYTPLQTVTEQYFNTSSYAESAASGIITDRIGIITDVITNGLDNVPALERAQISSIKMQTRVPTNDLLLITNTTVNEVLFNFTDPDKGASVKYITDEERLTKGVEDDFPKFLERTGTITTVYLNVNTDNPTYGPNAIVQLEANKEFLQKETTAWIGNKVSTTVTYPNAKVLIDANKEWLADEVMAWFDLTYPNAHSTVQHEKCERDTKYNIDAIAYDILHGSNTQTIDVAKKYWEGTNSQLTNSGGEFTETTTSEISYALAVNNKLRDLIVNNVLTNTVYTTQQSPIVTVQTTNATDGEVKTINRVKELVGIFTSVIENGISVLPSAIPSWDDYTYNGPKCERDVGLQLDALVHDIKYGGNAETYMNAEKYWLGPTPQIDGDRSHELFAKDFVLRLINDYVFKNVTWPTLQVGSPVAQVTYYTEAELGIDARASELFAIINNVIEHGPSVLPLKDAPKIFSDTDDVQIFIDQGDLKVRPFDFGTDAIERMRVATAQSMLDADFEYGLQPTKWQAIATQRGYPSIFEVPGTDKQVQSVVTDASTGTGGIGQSLITVTTVGAHGMESGSPITIKALENSVAGASRAEGSFIISTTPTNNTFTFFAKSKVGNSNGEVLSTFYTQLRQAGFYTGAAIGTPTFAILSQGAAGVLYNPLAALIGSDKITFQGTAPEVGAPIIVEAGVATAVYTYSAADALRTAGTYSDVLGTSSSVVASLVVPTCDIVVDGSGAATATIVTGGRRNAIDDVITVLDSQLGSGGAANLTFNIQTIRDGTGKIPTGAQVTAVLGTGGPIQTLQTSSDVAIGSNVIPVTNTSGVLAGHGVDRGDGTAVYVSSVVGNNINLDGNTTNTIIGNVVSYIDVAGSNVAGAGVGGTFDINRNGGVYSVTINNDGTDYETGDVIIVLGNALGGTTPEHDLRIEITDANVTGDIITISTTGTAFDGTANYIGLVGTNANGVGTGALFDISYTNNTYSVSLAQPTYTTLSGTNLGGIGTGASIDLVTLNNVYSASINATEDNSADYEVGDIIKIDGVGLGGAASTNDAIIKVDTVGGTGDITGISVTGTAVDADVSYQNVTFTTGSIGGVTANLSVRRLGTTYEVGITGGGSGYSANDTLNVLGTDVGGTSPANDATITVATVGGGGEILTAGIVGTAVNTQTYADIQNGLNQVGSSAVFDATVNYNNTYTVIIGNTGGTNYGVDQKIKLLGTAFGNGATPANDVEITITSVAVTGLITGISFTGTSADATIGYVLGDRLIVLGSSIGGLDTTHDAIINITGVSAGRITGITIVGAAPDATETYVNPTYSTNTVSGQNASFTVTRLDVAYTAVVIIPGTGYLAGETFDIDGALLGGATTTNDVQITVATVGGGGEILTITITGTALDQKTYLGISQAAGQAVMKIGAGSTWDVALAGGAYTPTNANPGTDYNATQTIKILGPQLGGASPTNDLEITINSVTGTGAIATFSHTGTAPGGTGSYTDTPGTNLGNVGINATFDVIRSTGSYSSLLVNNGGGNYLVGNKIKIAGSTLGGIDPTNDLVLTITGVGVGGDITTVTGTGTALSGTVVKTYSTVTMSEQTTAALVAFDTQAFAALATVEITFSSAHGLVPGNSFIITIASDSGSNNHTLCEGPFFAQQIPTNLTMRYQCRAPGTISDVDDIVGNIYPRPDSFFVHRPYDGGVMLGTGGPQHGSQAIRQSKKYIRYQSGKGIMYTTGALFAPSYDLLNVVADGLEIGSFITVTTDDVDHGLQIGGVIRLIGIETPGYNGDYTVSSITSEREFKVIADFKLGSLTPILSARAQVSLLTWHGATVRSGAFDDQNGIFMEYDGENFTCVQRTATLQLAGVVSIAVDSNTCTGVGTRFRDQIKAGDRIVIKGMTHVISEIVNDTNMYVTPDFRGVTPASACKICLVSDKKTKSNEFNKDKLDGTGSSGYIIDVSKMQMMGIQYSWYGAGFIDYMLRGDDGNFVFFHRMRNSNINTEAFMRTGNMPVRYEITNEGPNGKLAADIDDNQTTVPLVDAKYFPSSGTIFIDGEMISYTNISGDTLTGCTRAAPMSNYASGANRTYTAGLAATHTAKTGVPLISNTISPIISHWGSAFLTDGGFDTDRGYIFSYASTGNEITTTRNTVFMLRLAPSVSNAIVGDLGERELLNRAQLLLEGVEVTSDTSTGGIVIEGVLNPQNYPLDPGNVGWGGLSGLAAGGQPSFAQVAPGGGVTWSTGATQVVRNATTTGQLSASADSLYNRSNTNYHYFSTSEWDGLDDNVTNGTEIIATGSPSSGASDFPAGTTVLDIYEETWYNRVRIRTTQRNSGYISAGEAITFGVGGELSYTNYLFFTKTSWETTQAVSGTEVSDAKFPAGTAVSNVQGPLEFGGTEYYKVTFSQTSIATVAAGATVGFLFGQPPYAQPGETVFSFIANPGELANLDLTGLKELTNTTLGGRGTYPNGPDVLAINVYKTSGAAVDANIILRWGEAQA